MKSDETDAPNEDAPAREMSPVELIESLRAEIDASGFRASHRLTRDEVHDRKLTRQGWA